MQQREKQFKKKMLAELPRRTSDRIAIKAAQRIEEVERWLQIVNVWVVYKDEYSYRKDKML